MQRINHLENLSLEFELDSAYGDDPDDAESEEMIANETVILCGTVGTGVLEDAHYIYVDPEYEGELSLEQRAVYSLLLTLQESSVYTVTTLGKLAAILELKWSLALAKRMENLQSLAVISGFKLS